MTATTAPARRHTLPNGLEVAYQSKAELLQFYDDIFEKRVYTRHGITLRAGDCVFDVGANIGMFTLFVASQVPGARILAFEPAPPLHAILRANAAPYGERVTLFDCGLSRRAGSAELTFYPHSSGMSSFYPDEHEEKAALRTLIRNERERGREGIAAVLRYEDELVEQRFRKEAWTCPLRTLSDVLREHPVPRIDLLKIDVEKSEMDVLAGLSVEDWVRVEQVVLEVHDLGDRLREVSELLQSRGFAVALEQDDLYRGSDRWNLYALREHIGAGTAAAAGPVQRGDHAAAVGRAEERARRLRETMRQTMQKGGRRP
jgi:phthiocerol/phenolphthiocerol synthesis type-I polyketide synthase E